MTNDPHNGGDISSGFGDSTVTGPVSDEKAEQMKQRSGEQDSSDSSADESAGDSEQDQASNEQDLTRD